MPSTTSTDMPARTLKDPSYEFTFLFNGATLKAEPAPDDSLRDAMLRSIEGHAGVSVSHCGPCKLTSKGYYRYPIILDGGKRGEAFIHAAT
jgi:hypothetical protein